MNKKVDLISPYDVFYNEKEMFYYFTTDDSVEYDVRLLNVDYLIDLPLLSVSLYPADNRVSRIGIKVSETTCLILKRMLDADSVLFYTCDPNDNRPHCRNRLFNMWFSRFNDGNYKKFSFSHGDVFSTVIISKSNTLYEQYQKTIKKCIEEFEIQSTEK